MLRHRALACLFAGVVFLPHPIRASINVGRCQGAEAEHAQCVLLQDHDLGRADQPRRLQPRHPRLSRHRVNTAHAARSSVSVAGLPAPLVAKIREIAHACPGFHVISAFRPHARVAGSGRQSLHAVRKAADIAGPHPQCAYARLRGWPGGASVDYWRVHHIHLSWNPGGHEWHARFEHWHGQRYALRRRHLVVYARRLR